jgi:glucose-6-phosphate dehydrogenase assembly protein OpcA
MASTVNNAHTQSSELLPKGEGTPAKACLFNLVVFCQDGDRMDYFHELIQATVDHFPCRITLIRHVEGQKGESIDTQASRIQPSKLGQPNVSDQLLIQATTQALYRVPFLVLPYLLSDLPLFLIWDCDPATEQHILPTLQANASRLIFDSETIDNLQTFSRRILPYADPHQRDIVDLNWTRIGGWREIFYKIFDTAERLHQLQDANELRIAYNARENRFFHHSQTQAIYLQAWLATQLGWQFQALTTGKQQSEVRYKTAQGEVLVTLEPKKIEDRAPGSIFSFSLHNAHGVSYAAQRKPNTQQVTVDAATDEACLLPYILNLRGTQLTYTFLKEMLYLYGSQHYRHMLQMLQQQDWTRA